MLSRGLKEELRWLGFTLVCAAFIGYSLGAFWPSIAIAMLGFVLWMFRKIALLEKWVANARRLDPPSDDFGSIWGEIADDVRLLNKRYQKDKLRLQAVVTRVQEMTSALTDAVILIDNRANIEWWNRAALQLFNFKDIDRGHKLANIIRQPRFVSYFENQEYNQPLETHSLHKEGQHLEFHVHPFGHGERLVVVRDITRVKRLEQMRKDFVSNVSHELRTPLTVVKGYIETLTDSPDMKPTWQAALNQVLKQCDRMSALVNDLITLSRLETEESQSKQHAVPLSTLLDSIVADAKELSTHDNHQFSVSGDQGVTILGNDRELHSAISNLVFNAVKYSPEGGKVSLTVRNTIQECIVSVADTGLGINPKHIPRITERFYRVDESRSSELGGTGLGLAIVKHVLMRHDADLKIQSRLGYGSTFSCHFPSHRVTAEKAA